MSSVNLMNEVEIEELLDGNNVLSMGSVGRDRDRDRDRDQDRGRDRDGEGRAHDNVIGDLEDIYNDYVIKPNDTMPVNT